jgi:hypothetical protein
VVCPKRLGDTSPDIGTHGCHRLSPTVGMLGKQEAVALLHHRKDGRVRKVELSTSCLPLLCILASLSVLQQEVKNVEAYRAKNQQDKTGNPCR